MMDKSIGIMAFNEKIQLFVSIVSYLSYNNVLTENN
jgi:hypothetical protein